MKVDSSVRLPLCCAYGATRRPNRSAFAADERNESTETLFSSDATLRNAEDWLLRLDYSASKPSPHQKQQRQRFEQVRGLLLHVLPEVEDLRIVDPGGTNPAQRVEFQTPYGWVAMRSLGHGYQTLIAWLVDFVSRLVERYPDSADPLAEPAIVLIDEIDLHLHPHWQRKLIGYLTERFPKTQFIASAHSPLIVQAAGDANLAVLRREGDQVVIDNDVQRIRGWRIDQIYTSDLFGLESARPPELDALLKRRQALLAKPKLSAADQRELQQLEQQIGPLPGGETQQEAETLQLIKDSLDLLTKQTPE